MKQAGWVAALVMLSCAAVRAEDKLVPQVSVYGTATTMVTPDRMEWRLTVNNKGKELADVAKRHTEIVDAVLSFLKGKGVAEENLQTARMEFGENWEYRNNSRVMEGYFASTAVSFKIDDFSKYSDIWMGLARISDVSIDGVSYDISKRIEYQNKTRQQALLAAREKAAAMAETLGARIGEPLVIEEQVSSESSWRDNRAGNLFSHVESVEEEGLPIAPGRIPIRIRVKAAFRLVPEGM